MSQLEIALDTIYHDLDHQFKVYKFNFKDNVKNQSKISVTTKTTEATSIFTAQLHHLMHYSLRMANTMYQDFDSNIKSKNEYETFLMDVFNLRDKYIIDFSERVINVSETEFIDSNKDIDTNGTLNDLYNYEKQLLREMDSAMDELAMECGPYYLKSLTDLRIHQVSDTMISYNSNLTAQEQQSKIMHLERELMPTTMYQADRQYLRDPNLTTIHLHFDSNDFATIYLKETNNTYNPMTTYKYRNEHIHNLFSRSTTIMQNIAFSAPLHRKHIDRKKVLHPQIH